MLKIIAAALAALLVLPHGGASAQAWPSKPIRFVIPFGAGSATDALRRIAGQELEQMLGQPVIVVPKPGADGALSAGEVKRAAPDGYTFLFGTNSPLAVVPNMQKEQPYDVLADFTPVTFLGDNTFFIVVHPSLPVTTLAELIAYARASPKPLNYATGNTYAFVSMAMLAANNRIALEAIRYKSEPDALADLLSGRVPLMNSTVDVGPGARQGRPAAGAVDGVRRAQPPAARRALDRRGRPNQIPDRPLVRPGRPGRRAAGDRRRHEQGDGRDPRQARGPRADGTARLRAEVVDAGSACRLHEGPARGLEGRPQGRWHRAAITRRSLPFATRRRGSLARQWLGLVENGVSCSSCVQHERSWVCR